MDMLKKHRATLQYNMLSFLSNVQSRQIYESISPLKIHLLCFIASFYLHCPFFALLKVKKALSILKKL